MNQEILNKEWVICANFPTWTYMEGTPNCEMCGKPNNDPNTRPSKWIGMKLLSLRINTPPTTFTYFWHYDSEKDYLHVCRYCVPLLKLVGKGSRSWQNILNKE